MLHFYLQGDTMAGKKIHDNETKTHLLQCAK